MAQNDKERINMDIQELLFSTVRASTLIIDFKRVVTLLVNSKEKYNEPPPGSNKDFNKSIAVQMRYAAFNYYDGMITEIKNNPFINSENILSFEELKRVCGVDF